MRTAILIFLMATAAWGQSNEPFHFTDQSIDFSGKHIIVDNNGKVTFSKGLKLDEASMLFWKSLEKSYATSLFSKLEKIADTLALILQKQTELEKKIEAMQTLILQKQTELEKKIGAMGGLQLIL